jgi:hypothetical protein
MIGVQSNFARWRNGFDLIRQGLIFGPSRPWASFKHTSAFENRRTGGERLKWAPISRDLGGPKADRGLVLWQLSGPLTDIRGAQRLVCQVPLAEVAGSFDHLLGAGSENPADQPASELSHWNPLLRAKCGVYRRLHGAKSAAA